jgi:acetyl esterase/lipase
MTQTVEGSEQAGGQLPPVGPLPPYDPEFDAGLAAMQAQGFLPPALTSAEQIPVLRAWMTQAFAVTDDELTRNGAYTLEERQVPGPAGAPEITLLIVRPAAADTATPVIYHTHGGGMVVGGRRDGVPGMLDLAEPSGAAVVSVEYRLAPEHPHPAPVEDCYAGLKWTAEHAEELGLDADRIVIAGASAGGGLAAATALLARDEGGPALFGQMLICPMLDDRNDTASARQSYDKGTWSGLGNHVGWTALLGDRKGSADLSPVASASRATDLSGLPPALLDVGSAEVFRSETVEYAERIWQAGGVAELHVWPGGFHGYDMFVPQSPVSQATVRARRDWLGRLLSS